MHHMTTDGLPLRRTPRPDCHPKWSREGKAWRFLEKALNPMTQFQAIGAGEAFIQELRSGGAQ